MALTPPPLIVVVHGGRACAQAFVARDGAAEAGARSRLVAVADLAVGDPGSGGPGSGGPGSGGPGEEQWELLAEADGILFGAPLPLPEALARGGWQGKPAAGFVRPDGDAEGRLRELAAMAEALGMSWIGPAGPPGRFVGPGPDPVLDAVRRLGSRMARMARLAGAAPGGVS
ncbi:hypothetical protein OHS33_17165 [Streptomyces sp. NBC_00536]|uniref:hypothetical protein n=1 Tax=Streptomyces sp. NBC_00536 TaxID=2975769 RepID=UPI002E7FEA12|nr:hypothetical protein [Streptomyces sp. NBC_00536]WUC79912.1 hypothetical protein OHS33_17165 [Streptomyces sp. NBC_00536]